MCWQSRNLGASTSWNPQGLSRDFFAFTITTTQEISKTPFIENPTEFHERSINKANYIILRLQYGRPFGHLEGKLYIKPWGAQVANSWLQGYTPSSLTYTWGTGHGPLECPVRPSEQTLIIRNKRTYPKIQMYHIVFYIQDYMFRLFGHHQVYQVTNKNNLRNVNRNSSLNDKNKILFFTMKKRLIYEDSYFMYRCCKWNCNFAIFCSNVLMLSFYMYFFMTWQPSWA